MSDQPQEAQVDYGAGISEPCPHCGSRNPDFHYLRCALFLKPESQPQEASAHHSVDANEMVEASAQGEVEVTLEEKARRFDEIMPANQEWVFCRCGRKIIQASNGRWIHWYSDDRLCECAKPAIPEGATVKDEEEKFPTTAREWLEDALGRYQVTHIHSSVREALKLLTPRLTVCNFPSCECTDGERRRCEEYDKQQRKAQPPAPLASGEGVSDERLHYLQNANYWDGTQFLPTIEALMAREIIQARTPKAEGVAEGEAGAASEREAFEAEWAKYADGRVPPPELESDEAEMAWHFWQASSLHCLYRPKKEGKP